MNESMFLTWLRGQNYSPVSVNAYHSRVRKFAEFANREWGSIPKAETDLHKAIALFIERLSRTGISDFAINNQLSALQLYCRSLGFKQVPLPRRYSYTRTVKIISHEGLVRLRITLQGLPLREQALINLLLETGLRSRECRALNLGDLRFMHNETIEIKVLSTWQRYIVSGLTFRVLVQWWQHCRRESSESDDLPLFPNKQGKRLSTSSLDSLIRVAGQKARMVISARTLRETYLQSLISSGNSIWDLRSKGGFSTLSGAASYLCRFDQRQVTSVEIYGQPGPSL